MAIDYYHNPRCSTSRKALQMLRDEGVEPNIIEYLKTPPDKARLTQILKFMEMSPRELIRKREKDTIKATGVDNEDLADEAIIDAMVANPILIERPIIVNGNQARLGRPAEKVLEVV
jgi:arsenate reductase